MVNQIIAHGNRRWTVNGRTRITRAVFSDANRFGSCTRPASKPGELLSLARLTHPRHCLVYGRAPDTPLAMTGFRNALTTEEIV